MLLSLFVLKQDRLKNVDLMQRCTYKQTQDHSSAATTKRSIFKGHKVVMSRRLTFYHHRLVG